MNIIIRFFPVHTDKNAMLKEYMIDHIIDSFVEKNEPIPEEVNKLIEIYNNKNKNFLRLCLTFFIISILNIFIL